MNKKTFYVTTPIYYPSGNLHIGHAYTTTLADILARYKKEMNYDVYFLTGSDEHGQKIQQKAEEAGVSPQIFVDKMVMSFKSLWKELDIHYDRFIRTTDEDHVEAVKKIFSELYKHDFIYPSKYQGKYCVSCEEFLTAAQMQDNFKHIVCGNEAINFEEETYMLRVSRFKDFLVNLLQQDFLIPENRRKEMLNNFVLNDLEDLSVTRVSFDWGIKIDENNKHVHVIYVWLDALSNYITALGYKSNHDELMKKFWGTDTEIVHLVGKEITRFHSIYWPIMLEALGLRTPTKLLSHGWIMNKELKMSKSIGNVINPLEVIKQYGSDSLRFYIANNLPTDRDGNYTDELFRESFNTNLANNIGNLLSRSSNMIIKYFDGNLKKIMNGKEDIFIEAKKTIKKYQKLMDEYKIAEATDVAMKLGQACNKWIESTRPWDLEKNGKLEELEMFLANVREIILVVCFLLKPIIIKNYDRMISQLGCESKDVSFSTIITGKIKFKKITNKDIIFERLK